MERIDAARRQRGLQGTDDYLAQWRWSDEQEREGIGAGGRRRRSSRELEAAGRLVERALHAGHAHRQRSHDTLRQLASSLFDCRRARSASACRPPASSNGKCKECVVEITDGMDAPVAAHRRRSLTSRRRSGCRVRRASPRTSGDDRVPHDAPRPDAHRAARAAPAGQRARRLTLDPAVTRDGDRIVDRIDGDEIARSSRPDPRPRDGSRHDDGRPPPDQSRNRRAGRRRVVREPAALRRLRRHVAHPLRHRASAASC